MHEAEHDKVIQATKKGELNSENTSFFRELRERFKFDHKMHDELEWRRKVIAITEELDQYLWSYVPIGLMRQ